MGHLAFIDRRCPCGEGKVKWESWERYSSWGGAEFDPVEILCPVCKETHEIKRIGGTDKYGTEYSYVVIRNKETGEPWHGKD